MPLLQRWCSTRLTHSITSHVDTLLCNHRLLIFIRHEYARILRRLRVRPSPTRLTRLHDKLAIMKSSIILEPGEQCSWFKLYKCVVPQSLWIMLQLIRNHLAHSTDLIRPHNTIQVIQKIFQHVFRPHPWNVRCLPSCPQADFLLCWWSRVHSGSPEPRKISRFDSYRLWLH